MGIVFLNEAKVVKKIAFLHYKSKNDSFEPFKINELGKLRKKLRGMRSFLFSNMLGVKKQVIYFSKPNQEVLHISYVLPQQPSQRGQLLLKSGEF